MNINAYPDIILKCIQRWKDANYLYITPPGIYIIKCIYIYYIYSYIWPKLFIYNTTRYILYIIKYIYITPPGLFIYIIHIYNTTRYIYIYNTYILILIPPVIYIIVIYIIYLYMIRYMYMYNIYMIQICYYKI